MRLVSLEMKNFFCFSHAIFKFQENLASLIIGENGSGKSTIFEGIIYSLFGTTLKAVGKDDVVKRGETACSSKLELQRGNDKIVIIRSRSISKQTSQLLISINERDETRSSLKESQLFLNNLLGVDFEVFKNSILFGQNDVSQFIEGGDKFRKDLVSKVFKFDKLDKCLEQSKEELVDLTLKNTEVVSKISVLQTQVLELPQWIVKEVSLRKSLELSETSLVGLKSDLVLRERAASDLVLQQQEVRLLEENLRLVSSEIVQYREKSKKEKERQVQERILFQRSIDEYQRRLTKLQQDKVRREEIQYKIDAFESDLSSLPTPTLKERLVEKDKLTTQVVQESTLLQTTKTQLQDLQKLGGECPLCYSEISSEHIEGVRSEFVKRELQHSLLHGEYLGKLVTLTEEITYIEKVQRELQLAINEKNQVHFEEEDLISCTNQLQEFQNQLSQVQISSEIEDPLLKTKILQEQDLRTRISQISFDHNELLVIQKEVDTLKYGVTTQEKLISNNRVEIGKCQEMINHLTSLQKERETLEESLKKVREELQILEYCCNVFGREGVKTYFIDSIIPLFQDRINYYLSILTEGRTTVSLQTQVENKKGDLLERFELLIHTGNYTMTYESYSGGEKKRIAIALRIALADLIRVYLGVQVEFLLFDEVTDSLDTSGYDRFIDLLNNLRQNFSHILIISHDEEIKNRFDSIIRITKNEEAPMDHGR